VSLACKQFLFPTEPRGLTPSTSEHEYDQAAGLASASHTSTKNYDRTHLPRLAPAESTAPHAAAAAGGWLLAAQREKRNDSAAFPTPKSSEKPTEMPPPLLLLLAAAVLFPLAAAQGFRGFSYLLDCGAASATTDSRGLRWEPDAPYVSAGAPRALDLPLHGGGLVDPTLARLRAFPHRPGAKFCYALPVDPNRHYLVRPIFFYGAPSPSAPQPPVFDLIVDGTFWTAINSTDDALAGSASSFEGVFPARGRNMSFCLGANRDYTDAGPFISALQVIQLDDPVYNATDFRTSAMGLIARTKFGSSGDLMR
jgi:hypothetical protein